MLKLFEILALGIVVVYADFEIPHCSDGNVLLPSSMNCKDKEDHRWCQNTYPPNGMGVGKSTKRPGRCSGDSAPGSLQTFVDAAIKYCPYSCGYCCMTPEYNCQNAAVPNLNCSAISMNMCKDVQWRQAIAENCPSNCGFCLLNNCIDVAPDCAVHTTICNNVNLQDFVKVNCRRTCNLCATTTTTASVTSSMAVTTINTACVDTHRNCVNFVRNGFCSNPHNGIALKRKHCAKSCGLC